MDTERMKTYYVAIAINDTLKAIQCRECEIPCKMEKYTKEILRDYLNNVQIDAVMNGDDVVDTQYFITRSSGQIVISRRVEEIFVGYIFNSKRMREEVFATVYGGEFVGEIPRPATITKPTKELSNQFIVELSAEVKRRAPDC